MQYATPLDSRCLKETFQTSLSRQRNIVLRACSLRNPVLDFAESVSRGLAMKPRRLECRFLYDARGSEFYEQICAQPEYYLTRTEATILRGHASAISQETGPCHLIELGSGSSAKTDHLLAAYQGHDRPVRYTPIDISASALHTAGQAILDKRPRVQVVGVHGTYRDSFPILQCASPALVLFLGSTIGNFTPEEEREFWDDVSANLHAGDYFLLGVDLVKEKGILEAAYNDTAGVTADFTKNYFVRMNRDLGCSLDVGQIEHVAAYNETASQIEIYAEFRRGQRTRIRPTGNCFSVKSGERILVEISRKFRLAEVKSTLASYGLRTVRTFADERDWFALLLMRKTHS